MILERSGASQNAAPGSPICALRRSCGRGEHDAVAFSLDLDPISFVDGQLVPDPLW
jgi:hypothetical protein